jgi:hypothetical protein
LKICIRDDFWKSFNKLPPYAKKQANRAFEHLSLDVRYPSLHFKCVNKKLERYSIRINQKGYRALGHLIDGDVWWYWIGGDHDEYERKIRE